MKCLKLIDCTLGVYIAFGVILSGTFNCCYAQKMNQETEDVIYLKDGSILRGTLLEEGRDDQLKIELMGGSVFVIHPSEIDSVTLEPAKFIRKSFKENKKLLPITFREKGIYHIFDLGFGFGEGRYGEGFNANLSYILEYHVNQYLNTGIGIGIDSYYDGSLFPLFLDVRGDVVQKKISPYYQASVGWAFLGAGIWPTQVFDGGLHYQLGLGIKINTRRKHEWYIGMEFKSQNTYQEMTEWIWDPQFVNGREVLISGNRTYHRLGLNIGIGF